MLELDVGGGEAEAAANLVPVHDPSGNAVGAAQEPGGVVHVPRGQGGPHGGTGNPLSCHVQGRHRFDPKAVGAARALQEGKIPSPGLAKAEIVTDEEMANTQPGDQQAVDEVLGGEAREVAVKAADVNSIHAGGLQQQELFPQGGQAGRRLGGGEELPRVGLEGQDHCWQTQASCLLPQEGEQGLMAQVHAIEIADGEHRRLLGAGGNASDDLHKRWKKSAIIAGTAPIAEGGGQSAKAWGPAGPRVGSGVETGDVGAGRRRGVGEILADALQNGIGHLVLIGVVV